jgi:hypothetical protein
MPQNKIVFPIQNSLRLIYDTPENQGLFSSDNKLHLIISREDYNAANPKQKEVIQGVAAPIVNRTTNYYQFEATCRDNREIIKDVLESIEKTGNLDTQGINLTYNPCDEPHVIVHDYHRFDAYNDRSVGYTVRVGVLLVEDLKGSIRGSNGQNYNKGIRVVFTHTHNLIGGNLVKV